MVGLLKAVVLEFGGTREAWKGGTLSLKVLRADLLLKWVVGVCWAGAERGAKATWRSYRNR